MSKKCLVTGAGGFLGRKLTAQLRAEGNVVVGMDISCEGANCDSVHQADITQPILSAPFEGVDTIFHLAGKVHALSEVKQDDSEYFRINTEGTRNVLETARRAGVKRFVFFSTVKAMSRDERETGIEADSNPETRALTETDLIEPDTPYGRSKLEAEKLVLHGGYVPEPVVLRLCMVYGAGAKGNIQKMLKAIDDHRFPPLPEVGNRRSMVHVQDVIQAAMLAAEKPEADGNIFIVSDGYAYSTRQIYKCICRALGRPCPRWSVPLWFLHGLGLSGDLIGRLRGRRFFFDSDALDKLIGWAWFSSRKIESMLGFQPTWNLERALSEMVDEIRQRQRSADV
jgi:nucleoside-diphosphate-sugar epimerase